MSALKNIFKGSNIIVSLVVLLIYLVYSYLQTNNLPDLATLNKYVNQFLIPTPTVSPVPTQEDIIEEHEPDVVSEPSQAVAGAATVRQQAQVVKVVDGDTIDVSLNGKTEKIRIIGIDTPEVVDPRKPVQCFGREASNFAKQTLNGKTVYLESDSTQDNRDKYQRLLRFVFMESNVDFGLLMISEGYAHEYTYDRPYKYQAAYKQAEQEARTNKKGLWAENICT